MARSALQMRYARFLETPVIRDFMRRGGQVFIATEGRALQDVQQLYACGHRTFAEKFVQEAIRKGIRAACPDVTLHYFGGLQSNKVRKAADVFDAIESIDRTKIALTLKRVMMENPGSPLKQVLVQINSGREPQKKGVDPDHADALIRFCKALGLPLTGLMTIPPKGQDATPYFKQLRRLADAHALEHCVMGMSDDYAQAIHCGATAIRVARVIFDAAGGAGR